MSEDDTQGEEKEDMLEENMHEERKGYDRMGRNSEESSRVCRFCKNLIHS
ncbi:unnamed protein product [Cylicostephanus goldi]|uniref:Uncharacterized protein n=1 Tax=Cylicostephanus goldi TaxID=71465 RepID=A0A3P6RUF1_CYLGO|nr:unnamed protein product [Cylicostephanus goldi]